MLGLFRYKSRRASNGTLPASQHSARPFLVLAAVMPRTAYCAPPACDSINVATKDINAIYCALIVLHCKNYEDRLTGSVWKEEIVTKPNETNGMNNKTLSAEKHTPMMQY